MYHQYVMCVQKLLWKIICEPKRYSVNGKNNLRTKNLRPTKKRLFSEIGFCEGGASAIAIKTCDAPRFSGLRAGVSLRVVACRCVRAACPDGRNDFLVVWFYFWYCCKYGKYCKKVSEAARRATDKWSGGADTSEIVRHTTSYRTVAVPGKYATEHQFCFLIAKIPRTLIDWFPTRRATASIPLFGHEMAGGNHKSESIRSRMQNWCGGSCYSSPCWAVVGFPVKTLNRFKPPLTRHFATKIFDWNKNRCVSRSGYGRENSQQCTVIAMPYS